MEENHVIRRIYNQATIKFVKALRLEAEFSNLYLFLDEHKEELRGTEYEEEALSIVVWLTTFLLLLDENKRDWKAIVEQLQAIGDIESIERWLQV